MAEIVPLVFSAFGGAGLVYALRALGRALDSLHWPVREAEVLSCVITESRGGHFGKRYGPTVRYRYRHNGVLYEGDRIMFSGFALSSRSRAEAEQFLVPFAIGTRILVHVCPRNPRLSVIEPGVDRSLKSFLFTASFLLFMGLGGLFGWWA
jgi:hypothetical protein